MKVVVLWLINENGEILMARRAEHMRTDAGVWGPSVSGKVDDGESSRQAVLRETQEELGLMPGDIAPVFLHDELYADHSDGRRREFSFYYAPVTKDITNRFRLEVKEVSETRWFKRDELKHLVDAGSETIIISSATTLWHNIFAHLQPIATSI